ncbi:MAG: GNAT family N-acetyltransferase [Alphaproteobacteria bacterium]
MELTDNKEQSRYEMAVGDALAIADYRRAGSVMFIDRVFVPDSLRGQGVAGRLMEQVIAHAYKHNLEIHPVCSYAIAYMKRHGIE